MLGLVFDAPGPKWKKTVSVKGEALTVAFSDDKSHVYLTLWEQRAPMTPEDYRETTLAHLKKENKTEELSRGSREVAGAQAATIRCRDEHYLSDACYFLRDGVFYSLAIYTPKKDKKSLSALTDRVLAGLRWEKPGIALPKKAPFKLEEKEKGRVVTVVRGKGEDAAFRYLEAIPGAALANGGLPVILVVDKEYGEPARAFLRKFRPEKILARPCRWKSGGTVVVAERSLKDAVPKAALAAKLKCPLVVAGPDLESRLRKLKPLRIVRESPGASGYAALCNVAEGFESVFAAALAAAHGGSVLTVDRPVRWHEGRLDAKGEGVIGGVKVGAPIIGKIKLTDKYEAPRFGHPRIEIDGHWEEPPIGSTVRIGDKRFMLSARFAQPSGAMIASHDGKGSVFLLEPDPNELREELAPRLAGVETLAIVGRPDRIPFFYSECRSYFEGYALNQEVVSDEPYAPGLAVGRLLPDGLETGSATIATTIAYPQLTGDWKSRAVVIQPGFAKKEVESGYQWVMPDAEALLRGVAADLAQAGVACDRFFRDRVDAGAAVESLSKAGWITFHNHADQREWGIHPESKIVPKWKNRVLDKPPEGTRELPELDGAPIVYCGGCGSAGVDVGIPPDETHPERFFALGAVAYLGNTRTASSGAEYLIKTFFNRLIYGGAALGTAFRDGRAFLRHLLEMRHLNPGFEDWLQDPIMYDVIREQYFNMNLFGDPGLRPFLPKIPASPVTASLDKGKLVIERKAPERIDAVQILPMFAKGAAREALVRTGAGLTFSEVPLNFLDREHGLSPLRTEPKVPPGAWVDLPLPLGAEIARIRLIEGPRWADRGFAVEESRLRMFVPLTYSTLEAGEGEAAQRVVFDVTLKKGGAKARTRVLDRIKWTETGGPASGIVSPEAKPVCDALDARRYSPVKSGLRSLEMTISIPTSEQFRQTRFHALWRKDRGIKLEASGLPERWRPWRNSILHGVRGFIERTVLGGEGAPPAFQSYHVDVERRDAEETILNYRPAAAREGGEFIKAHVSPDGLLIKEKRRRFGVWFSTEYEWRDIGPGVVADKVKLSDVGMATAEVRYEYGEFSGFHLVTRMVSSTPGYMPDSEYRVDYSRVLGKSGSSNSPRPLAKNKHPKTTPHP